MIYENHFSLNQRPFTIAPNPDFLFASGQYQEALAALEYGMLHRGGFVLLTGEVGTGKTTLCKHLLKQVPSNTEVALILHPQLDRLEMLQLICREFNIKFSAADREIILIELITEFLLNVYSKGGYSVLIIDEAQHLDFQVLELIRLLTNLETHQDKLLQIILLGQPELQVRLNHYSLRQLNQRFTARFHLKTLTLSQVSQYISHRLKVAGADTAIFSWLAILAIYRISGGVPRLINLIADRSLMGGYALNKNTIGPLVVYQASKEVLPIPNNAPMKKAGIALATTATLILMLFYVGNQKSFIDSFMNNPLALINQFYSNAKCEDAASCWSGVMPVNLLSQSKGAQILKNGVWVDWHKGLIGDATALVNVRMPNMNDYGSVSLSVGDDHESISWVRQSLEAIFDHQNIELNGTENWQLIQPGRNGYSQNVDTFYDVLLESQVKHFQRVHGLSVDGVIGQQTLISLALVSEQKGGL